MFFFSSLKLNCESILFFIFHHFILFRNIIIIEVEQWISIVIDLNVSFHFEIVNLRCYLNDRDLLKRKITFDVCVSIAMTKKVEIYEIDDYVANLNNLFDAVVVKRLYREIFVESNDTIIETMKNVQTKAILISKIKFVIITKWKMYIQIIFNVRKFVIRYETRKNNKNVIDFHEIHIFMNRDCIRRIIINLIIDVFKFFNLRWKRHVTQNILKKLVFSLTIKIKHVHVRRYDFDSKMIQMYFDLTSILSIFENIKTFFIKLILNTNERIFENLNIFCVDFRTVQSNYTKFYFKHFTKHFLQMKNYSIIKKRSQIKILTLSILNL